MANSHSPMLINIGIYWNIDIFKDVAGLRLYFGIQIAGYMDNRFYISA